MKRKSSEEPRLIWCVRLSNSMPMRRLKPRHWAWIDPLHYLYVRGIESLWYRSERIVCSGLAAVEVEPAATRVGAATTS